MSITRRGFLGSMAAAAAAIGAGSWIEKIEKIEKEPEYGPCGIPADEIVAAQPMLPGTVAIYVNGMMQREGADYAIECDRLVFDYKVVRPGDSIVCLYTDEQGSLNFEHVR
jgi:hypothetical protein